MGPDCGRIQQFRSPPARGPCHRRSIPVQQELLRCAPVPGDYRAIAGSLPLSRLRSGPAAGQGSGRGGACAVKPMPLLRRRFGAYLVARTRLRRRGGNAYSASPLGLLASRGVAGVCACDWDSIPAGIFGGPGPPSRPTAAARLPAGRHARRGTGRRSGSAKRSRRPWPPRRCPCWFRAAGAAPARSGGAGSRRVGCGRSAA